jgi:23S rRNA (cytosine1962-C5)-methyltransferase
VTQKYQLLDCGGKRKVELFGEYKLIRPCPQALWEATDTSLWLNPDAEFIRNNNEKGTWKVFTKLPNTWEIKGLFDLTWKVEVNDFGNLGVFTEHWGYIPEVLNLLDKQFPVLNLFSYTGSNSLPLVYNGYKLTVVDSSKNAMTDYSNNLELNHLSRDGQRLILEDALKFINREVRRNNKYHSIMADAPSFGRGTKGEVFNIEDHLTVILEACKQLLAVDGKMILTLHSPRFTPAILQILVSSIFKDKKVTVSEILNSCASGQNLPSGFLVKIL